MRDFIKGTVGLFICGVGLVAFYRVGKTIMTPAPVKPFIALCNGQSFKIEALEFRPGADGCVEFWANSGKVAWICGCSAVGIAQEPTQSKQEVK